VSSTQAIVDRLDEMLSLLRSVEAKLGSSGERTSSVEVKTSTRGVDITTKAYAGSPITSAGDAAMDEFIRVGREVERRLTGQA